MFNAPLIALALCSLIATTSVAAASKYDSEVSAWKTYEDVAKWLKTNFVFDRSRQAQALAQLQQVGPNGALTRRPEALFEQRRGYCRDAAGFAKDALNRINPEHQARYVFIKNKYGPPNHWVTGFNVNGKLYVIDYGSGNHWKAMEGVHGPYESLENYKELLASLSIRNFDPELVTWRDIEGQED
ncbi:Transglutaminase-like domain containing protein [Comamonadaceae bacterium]